MSIFETISKISNFQNGDPHTAGIKLTHGTNHHEDNQLQSLQLPCRIS